MIFMICMSFALPNRLIVIDIRALKHAAPTLTDLRMIRMQVQSTYLLLSSLAQEIRRRQQPLMNIYLCSCPINSSQSPGLEITVPTLIQQPVGVLQRHRHEQAINLLHQRQ